MNPKIKELRKKAMQLPLTPGVYLMKNSSSEIIYVGKAKALKNRVSQYFGSEHNHTVKVRKMVENVDDFDVILTDSEFEALVLECSLIKQHLITPFEGGAKQGITLTLVPIVMRTMALESAIRRRNAGRN